MPHVLAITRPDDEHAHIVRWALGQKGVACSFFTGRGFPSQQTASIRARGTETSVFLPGVPDTVDVVWNRRTPTLDIDPSLHEADKPFVLDEAHHFMRAVQVALGRETRFVNPLDSVPGSDGKLVQMITAARCGLSTPETLFTNDPLELRRFAHASPSGIICKTFAPGIWESGPQVFMAYTSVVDDESLADDVSIRSCPEIYQHRVEVDHELRVTVMGSQVFAAKIVVDAARVDWRSAQGEEGAQLDLIPTLLEPRVHEACIALTHQLGLLFACIDLIVTPAGDCVLLEANPMGQFLWVEASCPELPMLDAFAQFIADPSPEFRYQPTGEVVRSSDFEQTSEADVLRKELEIVAACGSSPFVYKEETA